MRHALYTRLLVLVLGFGMFMQSALAETFNVTIAAGHAPVIVWIDALHSYFIPEVDRRLAEAGGEHQVNWTEAYSGTLAKIGGVLEAVESGIADMGLVGAVFEPGNLPLQIVSYYTPFASNDPELVVNAVHELHSQIPEMSEAWEKYNQTYLAGVGVENFNLYTKVPVNNIADLNGMKIGGAGPNLNWLKGADVSGVQIDLTTIYNDLQTGIYDGVLLFTSSASTIKLEEVAPYMLQVDFGAMSWAGLTVNKDTWDRFPSEVQEIFREVALDYMAEVIQRQQSESKRGLERMVADGLTVTKLSEDERVAWSASLPNIAQEWATPLEDAGLPASEVISAYLTKLEQEGAQIARDWTQE